MGVAYGTDLAQVRAVLLHAAKASPHVREEPGVSIAFTNLGANSLELEVRCWSDSVHHNDMVDDVRSRIYNALSAEDLEIPYQRIVVHPAGA